MPQERSLNPSSYAPVRDEPMISDCEDAARKIAKAEKMDAHIDMLLKMARGGKPCDGCDD